MTYRSFGEQTRHYFSRPHRAPARHPIAGPAAWRGDELAEQPSHWRFELADGDVREIESALASAARLPLGDIERADFPLPNLSSRFASWRAALDTGCGVVVLTGLPVARWSQAECERAFWGLGRHLGVPGGQNPQQELLGHVTDYGEEGDNPLVRRYRTSGNIDFHCDAADVVGLLCLQPAKSGGLSRIASSVAVYNALLDRHPNLVDELFGQHPLDSRGETRPGVAGWQAMQIGAWDGERLRTFYHSEYFRSAWRHDDVKPSQRAREFFDAYDALALELSIDMDLEAGDIQFISNHSVTHARTGYTDDPARPRHLLRLWLSLESEVQ